ncbi:hypothetical protein IAE33_002352 [Pseudomonas sp. S60]|nr:hypothetical protein [Pseudomonas sp. S60]
MTKRRRCYRSLLPINPSNAFSSTRPASASFCRRCCIHAWSSCKRCLASAPGVFFMPGNWACRSRKIRLWPFRVGRFPKILRGPVFRCGRFFGVLVSVGRCISTTGFDRPMTTKHAVLPMAAVCGAPRVRRFGLHRSVNLHTAATTCLTASAGRSIEDHIMLKIVPDPPQFPHSLEEAIMHDAARSR